MLFLSTLHVNAIANYVAMLDSTIIDESTIPITLNFSVEPTNSYTDFNGGTYTGTGTGTNSATTGSYSGANGSSSGSYSGTVASHTVSIPQISINGGSQSFRVSGTTTSSSFTGTGTLTLANLKTYSASATENSASESGSVSIGASTESGSLSVDASTISTTDTGTISLTTTRGGSCIMHLHIPYVFGLSLLNGVSIDPDKYYGWCPYINNLSFNSSNLTNVSNFCVLDSKGNIVYSDNNNINNLLHNCYFYLGSEILGNVANTLSVVNYFDFDVCVQSITDYRNVSISFNFLPRLRPVKNDYQDSVGNVQSDPIQHKLQEENNATASDTNTTTHSIFDSITAFFGSFFSNLIGVFVPEDGYFSTWFNNLNNLLEAKLGILYYPFAKVIYLFSELTTAFSGTADSTITFPAIEFTNSATGETYTFLAAQTVNLDDYNVATTSSANSSLVGTAPYASLIAIIRTLNGFVLVMALLGLLRQKLNLILRGEDNDS